MGNRMALAVDCYECTALGDDYYIDENGELQCWCDDCPNNPANQDFYSINLKTEKM